MLTDEEKIQRAKEIYYRRNGISYRGEEKKKRYSPLKMFLIIILIGASVYAYENKEKILTQETSKEIKDFLNTKIDVNSIFKKQEMKEENKTENEITEENQIEEKLIALMGGRAAEKLALEDISTGASNDLEVANDIAKNMVTVYGMSDSIGPIHINLEKDPYQLQLLGEKYTDLIGNEIKGLVNDAYFKAQTILSKNMDKLEIVSNDLLEKEVMTAERFEELMKN
mgnify:CR=1 FL=1